MTARAAGATEGTAARAALARLRASAARTRAALRSLPAAARVCMAVAVLNAAAWSLTTPPLQIPDESWHYEYVQYLVEHGRPPAPTPPRLSPSMEAVVRDLDMERIHGVPANGTITTDTERRRLEHDLAHVRGLDGNGGWYADVPEPPLYYALEALPFAVAKSGDVLDRLQLMRLVSALLAGVTVLLVFLFLREALPAHPWTWTVGALGLAFLPLFAEMGGGVNPDNLLFAVAAGVFLMFARIFRHGLTTRRAVAMGGLIGLGLLTKMNFAGLIPGIVLGLLAAAVREHRSLRPRTFRLPLLAFAVGALPALTMTALNRLAWERPAFGSGVYSWSDVHASAPQALEWLWEFYLPTLPGMKQITPWSFATREAWFRNYVGGLGWFDTHFAPWVYDAALVPAAIVLLLAIRTLVRHRRALRARAVELLVYAALAVGMLLMVAMASYDLWLLRAGGAAEARYLLPAVPLYAGTLVLATRGAGRRWMPVAGTAIVVLAVAHNAFGLLLEVSRYYA